MVGASLGLGFIMVAFFFLIPLWHLPVGSIFLLLLLSGAFAVDKPRRRRW
jgi:hypothetical protein